ncbi:hypothetical protein J6590_019456 [Homalodisca vitripennis]|nr:hypothetical protein J6590_019456 [Homalodisca vitripennis]
MILCVRHGVIVVLYERYDFVMILCMRDGVIVVLYERNVFVMILCVRHGVIMVLYERYDFVMILCMRDVEYQIDHKGIAENKQILRDLAFIRWSGIEWMTAILQLLHCCKYYHRPPYRELDSTVAGLFDPQDFARLHLTFPNSVYYDATPDIKKAHNVILRPLK